MLLVTTVSAVVTYQTEVVETIRSAVAVNLLAALVGFLLTAKLLTAPTGISLHNTFGDRWPGSRFYREILSSSDGPDPLKYSSYV